MIALTYKSSVVKDKPMDPSLSKEERQNIYDNLLDQLGWRHGVIARICGLSPSGLTEILKNDFKSGGVGRLDEFLRKNRGVSFVAYNTRVREEHEAYEANIQPRTTDIRPLDPLIQCIEGALATIKLPGIDQFVGLETVEIMLHQALKMLPSARASLIEKESSQTNGKKKNQI